MNITHLLIELAFFSSQERLCRYEEENRQRQHCFIICLVKVVGPHSHPQAFVHSFVGSFIYLFIYMSRSFISLVTPEYYFYFKNYLFIRLFWFRLFCE